MHPVAMIAELPVRNALGWARPQPERNFSR
jgi:hypothetical protein